MHNDVISQVNPPIHLMKENPTDYTVIVLEPYYGGSHKFFLDGLQKRFPFQFELLTLPARKWKWRMRLSAPYFARMLHDRSRVGANPENTLFFCSSFLDIAVFRSLLPRWARNIPLVTYYHENQFVYPVRNDDERDFHFALTNFTSLMASDRVAFNSMYNLNSFLSGCRKLLKICPDMRLDDPEREILDKATILYPAMDFTDIDAQADRERDTAPVILWNHRWEHDKNPDLFFQTLYEMDQQGIDFKLVVMGKSFRYQPEIFAQARRRLDHRILHFGYAPSREEYIGWLKKSDVVVSTALHEFFGIAVVEAVRAGCRPLLPRRLSYPELFSRDFLYAEKDFQKSLIRALASGRLQDTQAELITARFSWAKLAKPYEEWLISHHDYL
ncbi:DUF3524 domain-containing protein [Thermodesulfobacteriota bacterium]